MGSNGFPGRQPTIHMSSSSTPKKSDKADEGDPKPREITVKDERTPRTPRRVVRVRNNLMQGISVNVVGHDGAQSSIHLPAKGAHDIRWPAKTAADLGPDAASKVAKKFISVYEAEV